MLGTLRIHPHYLAYFNELAGGPDGGWRYLVDSNLDWGQDLPGLRRYLEAHGIQEIYLSWFGSAYPEHYGISYRALPGYPHNQGPPEKFAFNPYAPAPGVYAISATNLQGVVFADHDLFAWFRARQPEAKIGHSMFIYTIPDTPQLTAAVCLGQPLRDLPSQAVEAILWDNPVPLKTFQPETSFILPDRHPAWVISSPPLAFIPALQERFLAVSTARPDLGAWYLEDPAPLQEALAVQGNENPVWHSPAIAFPPGFERHSLAYPVDVGGVLKLTGYQYCELRIANCKLQIAHSSSQIATGNLYLITFWQAQRPVNPPLALFVHLLDAQGQVVSGWDGLDVSPAGWEPGDRLVQLHSLALPADLPAGTYQIELGLYRPDTMQRLPVLVDGAPVADRLLLAPVQIIP